MRRYEAYLFDLDGVLFRGQTAIQGAAETVNSLPKVAYLTNNSALHRDQVAEKLTGMGFAATPRQVVTSGYVAARSLAARGVHTVFLVGESGLRRELEEQGIQVVDAPPADAVLVGRDTGFSFQKLVLAQRAVLSGAEFYASNRDATYPVEDGLEPGSGALVAAVETAVGRSAVAFGKPEPEIARLALADLGVMKEQAILVGDRLDTDVECGRRVGMEFALVTTGVTSREEALAAGLLPNQIIEDLAMLRA